ncbi:MAG TPA: hypothetical protein VIS94_07710 [Desulfomonilia bacterium]
MDAEKKLIKLIAYLIELTQKGKLNWERHDPPDSIVTSHDNIVDFVYQTTFENKELRIYEERYKYWYDEDKWNWDSRVILDFADDYGRSVWKFPSLPGLWDLLESVKYREVDVDGFVSDIINKYKLDK